MHVQLSHFIRTSIDYHIYAMISTLFQPTLLALHYYFTIKYTNKKLYIVYSVFGKVFTIIYQAQVHYHIINSFFFPSKTI